MIFIIWFENDFEIESKYHYSSMLSHVPNSKASNKMTFFGFCHMEKASASFINVQFTEFAVEQEFM